MSGVLLVATTTRKAQAGGGPPYSGRMPNTPVTLRCSGPVTDRHDGRCPAEISGEIQNGLADGLAEWVTGQDWAWTGDVADFGGAEREQVVYCPAHA